jgi:hypothetical protein
MIVIAMIKALSDVTPVQKPIQKSNHSAMMARPACNSVFINGSFRALLLNGHCRSLSEIPACLIFRTIMDAM